LNRLQEMYNRYTQFSLTGPMQVLFEFSILQRVFAGKPAYELGQENLLKRFGPIIYTKVLLLDIGKFC